MTKTRFLFPLVAAALIGAGCFSKPILPETPSLQVPKPLNATSVSDLPCLSFKDRDGFANWLDAYEAGKEDGVRLATSAGLTATPNPKLTQDMRQSLNTGANPSFVCALNDQGSVAWIMEPAEQKDADCRDMFYVSMNGIGTASDLSAVGRKTDCSQLCKPKAQQENSLVWQCDIREKDGKKEWSQMTMDRSTGKTEVMKCQKDNLGMPVGCVE